MRVLSLCTGYGGLDLAVEGILGARTVAVSDIDKGACKILAHRFAHAPNLGDLKAIDWAAWAGTEVMTAGYPCQPFSHAGKREGTDDPRHIFPFIAEGIRAVGPRLVVLENVRGHLALGFDEVLGTLADIGYDARWVCVRASDVGAPHRRERMFIVATPHDARRIGGNEAVELDGDGPTKAHRAGVPYESDRGPRWARPGGGIASDAGSERHGRGQDGRRLGRVDGAHEGGSLERERAWEVAGDRGAETLADPEGIRAANEHPRSHNGLPTVSPIARTFPGDPARDHAAGDRLLGLRAGELETGVDWYRIEVQRDAVDWGQYKPAIRRWESVLGRPAPAPTERGAKGQPRLSPAFVEWMMGIPAGWVTDVPDLTRNEQLKALGNGVVWQQAAAALTFLLDARAVA